MASQPLVRPILEICADAPDRWIDRLAVFDLETTGVDVGTARVVTAFIGVLDASGTLVEERSWLVDPGVPIPAASTAVHGVTTEHAEANGQDAREAVGEIVAELASWFSQGVAVCAFNAAYDFSVIHAEARRHGIAPLHSPRPVIDPLVLDKQMDRFRRGKRTLGLVTEVYGVPLVDAHDASADAIAAGRVAQAMAMRFAELRIDPISLHEATERWAAAQNADFERYMRERDPSFTADRGAWPVRGAQHEDAHVPPSIPNPAPVLEAPYEAPPRLPPSATPR